MRPPTRPRAFEEEEELTSPPVSLRSYFLAFPEEGKEGLSAEEKAERKFKREGVLELCHNVRPLPPSSPRALADIVGLVRSGAPRRMLISSMPMGMRSLAAVRSCSSPSLRPPSPRPARPSSRTPASGPLLLSHLLVLPLLVLDVR